MNFKKLKVVLAALTLANGPIIEPALAADQPKTETRSQTSVDTSRLTPELVSLGKLVQSGVDEKVVLTYINNSAPKKNPTAEELVYLHELGLSSEGMVALLNSVPRVSLAQVPPPSAPVQAVPAQDVNQNAVAATQAPAVAAPVAGNTVISSPPTVVYTQPAPTTVYVQRPPVVTYVEPYPRFSFGLSFGHFGYFGHHGGYYRGHHSGWGHGHHGGRR